MTFAFTPAERRALTALYEAHAAGKAAPVRYGEHPRLVDLGIIHRGPNGFAYVTAARDVDEVEAGLERARVENAERAARAPAPPTEAERLAMRDKVPRKMQEAMARTTTDRRK